MRKILLVGDPHVVPEELDDCEALMRFVDNVAAEHGVHEVCILGDHHHTHNIIRAEVMAFWLRWCQGKRLLVGNHDYAGEGRSIHALMAYSDRANVVDKPVLDRGVLFMPYYSDREKFVRDANEAGGTTLVCHQTFAGSKYENGFYAQDGVNPDELNHRFIISGHIHTPQTFGKVTYVGAPRWRTLSDADVERAICIYTFDDEGAPVDKQDFDTGVVCRKIRYVLDTPETPFTGELDAGTDWRIDIKGSAEYVEARKQALGGPGVRIRTFKVEQGGVAVRESEGIAPAFRGFLSKYSPKHGTPGDVLKAMAEARLGV